MFHLHRVSSGKKPYTLVKWQVPDHPAFWPQVSVPAEGAWPRRAERAVGVAPSAREAWPRFGVLGRRLGRPRLFRFPSRTGFLVGWGRGELLTLASR